MTELFGPRFRELLRQIVVRARHQARSRSAREEAMRARRRALSSAGTFAGHRAYSAGDDVRSLDWNVFARTGELFMKVLEEDQPHSLTLLIDCSASMRAGQPPRDIGARRLAAILGAIALARLDGLQLITAANPAGVRLVGAVALPAMLETLAEIEFVRDVRPADDARALLELGSRGRLIWVSDFAEPDAFRDALTMLGSRRRREVLALLPSLPEDAAPTADGWLRLRDPERGITERMRIDGPLRAAMARQLQRLRRRQDAVFAQAGIRLVRHAIPAEGDYRVATWFPGSLLRRWRL